MKQIQIAHLDRNPANNARDNLAALCLSHHDEYDSRRSQSKGLTEAEIKLYRQELEAAIEKRRQQLFINVSGGTPGSGRASSSAELLGELAETVDAVTEAAESKHVAPTGIQIGAIARRAIDEAGDFEVATEAVAGLLRVASTYTAGFKWGSGLGERVPRSTPYTQALAILKLAGRTDYTLLDRMVRRLQRMALQREGGIEALADYSSIPTPEFIPAVEVLLALAQDGTEYVAEAALRRLAPLALGLGLGLDQRGLVLPPPPPVPSVGIDGQPREPAGQPEELRPWVHVCHRLAELPQGRFEQAMSGLSATSSVRRVIADPDLRDWDSARALLYGWAVLPGFISFDLGVPSDRLKDAVVLHRDLNDALRKVGAAAQSYCSATRRSLLSEDPPTVA